MNFVKIQTTRIIIFKVVCLNNYMFLYNDIRVTSTIEVSGVERSALLIATNWRDIRPTNGWKHILMLGHCLRCFPNISPTMVLTILCFL